MFQCSTEEIQSGLCVAQTGEQLSVFTFTFDTMTDDKTCPFRLARFECQQVHGARGGYSGNLEVVGVVGSLRQGGRVQMMSDDM